MGADVIQEPFAVNFGTFYHGSQQMIRIGSTDAAGYRSTLAQCISYTEAHHSIRVFSTFGQCRKELAHYLERVTAIEVIAIDHRIDGEVKYIDDNGEWTATPDTTPVSMNFWGFTPDYFAYSKEFFKAFLSDPKNMENLKSEFFIPLMVDKLINDGTATVEVLDTTSKWFGVTYPEDRQSVVDKIQALVDAGEYPAKLF